MQPEAGLHTGAGGGDQQPKAELQLWRQDTIQTGLGSWGPARFAAQRTAVASPGTSTSHSLWKTPSHQHRLLATTTHDTSTRGRAETQNQLRTALARPHKQKTTRPQRKIGERHAARARFSVRMHKNMHTFASQPRETGTQTYAAVEHAALDPQLCSNKSMSSARASAVVLLRALAHAHISTLANRTTSTDEAARVL